VREVPGDGLEMLGDVGQFPDGPLEVGVTARSLRGTASGAVGLLERAGRNRNDSSHLVPQPAHALLLPARCIGDAARVGSGIMRGAYDILQCLHRIGRQVLHAANRRLPAIHLFGNLGDLAQDRGDQSAGFP